MGKKEISGWSPSKPVSPLRPHLQASSLQILSGFLGPPFCLTFRTNQPEKGKVRMVSKNTKAVTIPWQIHERNPCGESAERGGKNERSIADPSLHML